MSECIRKASAFRRSGFIAQEVEKAAENIGYKFSGVDAPSDSKGLYGLRYDEFVMPLVKAVQELAAKNELLEEKLQKMEAALSSVTNNTSASNTITRLSGASLEQNAPNPFNNTTIIRYFIPGTSASANMVITNIKGQVLKSIPVSGTGAGQVMLESGSLSAGNYTYSLWIDGILIESKKMVIQK